MLRKSRVNFRPHDVVVVLFLVGLACLGMMAVFPEQGIALTGDFRLRFKTLASLSDTTARGGSIEGNLEDFLTQYDSIPDSNAKANDSLNVHRNENTASLQFLNGKADILYPFFEKLEMTRSSGEIMHILHYGDSQIESDRITGFLRSEIQKKFGGKGPGLIPPVPITESANISQKQSGNWKRYTAYGFQDIKSSHNHYGVMASYGRFTSTRTMEQLINADSVSAWLEFQPSYMAQQSSKVFNKATMLAGNNLMDVRVDVYLNDSLFDSSILKASSKLSTTTWTFPSTPKELRIEFRGIDSPDVHAICLEGSSGIMVDNIALRGSSGNIFTKINESDLRLSYEMLNPGLFILQFGGNTVPFVKTSQSAIDYGKYFQSQIRYLKSLCPDAAFIVIGPSDMSTRIEGEYQTWPFLEPVRDALKQAAFEENCAFWDMYEVMGGKNSMISWVESSPPYAAPDYTHFTPKGARKVAEIFFHSLMSEYDAWYKARLESYLYP